MYRLVVTLGSKEELLLRYAAEERGMAMADIVRQLLHTLPRPEAREGTKAELLRKVRGRRPVVTPPVDGLGFNEINVRTGSDEPKVVTPAGKPKVTEADRRFAAVWERNNPGQKWRGE